MATIRISDRAMWVGPITYGVAQSSTYAVFGSGSRRFYLMKGTPPTQSEFLEPGANFRETDRLATYSGFPFQKTSPNLVTITQFEILPTASGTVTWIYLDNSPTSSTITTSSRVALTVTGVGGGGDVEITNPSVTAGQAILVGPITFQLAQEYTY